MLAPTRKPRTERITLRFTGPASGREEALAAMKAVGFKVADEAVDWREAFPEYADEELPGVILAGARLREDMTQAELAEKTGIPQGHISEMESGKRPITVKTAKILGKALNFGYKVFL